MSAQPNPQCHKTKELELQYIRKLAFLKTRRAPKYINKSAVKIVVSETCRDAALHPPADRKLKGMQAVMLSIAAMVFAV